LNGLQIQDAQAGKHTLSNAVPIAREALLELVRCRRVNVTGCQILDGAPTGLLVEDCEDTLVSSCSVIDQRDVSLMKTGVEWRGEQAGNMFVQNRVSGASRGAIISQKSVHLNGNVTT